MPSYDYSCSACGNDFVSFNRIPERLSPENNPCPSCGRKSVRLVIRTAPALADPYRMGKIKPPSGFNQVLNRIGSENKDHTMNIRD